MTFGLIAIVILLVYLALEKRSELGSVEELAQAIARAEGYYVSGSLPQRRNNPGALKLDGNEITQFATPSEGWAALHRQLEKILNGESAFYTPDMSIRQVAEIWTGGDKPDAWARIVAGELQVDETLSIGAVIYA